MDHILYRKYDQTDLVRMRRLFQGWKFDLQIEDPVKKAYHLDGPLNYILGIDAAWGESVKYPNARIKRLK